MPSGIAVAAALADSPSRQRLADAAALDLVVVARARAALCTMARHCVPVGAILVGRRRSAAASKRRESASSRSRQIRCTAVRDRRGSRRSLSQCDGRRRRRRESRRHHPVRTPARPGNRCRAGTAPAASASASVSGVLVLQFAGGADGHVGADVGVEDSPACSVIDQVRSANDSNATQPPSWLMLGGRSGTAAVARLSRRGSSLTRTVVVIASGSRTYTCE